MCEAQIKDPAPHVKVTALKEVPVLFIHPLTLFSLSERTKNTDSRYPYSGNFDVVVGLGIGRFVPIFHQLSTEILTVQYAII